MPRFKNIIFHQYSPKIKLVLKKNAKFSSAWGSAPRPPITSPAGGSAPRHSPLNCEFLATRLPHFALFTIIWVFAAFVLNNFFFILQVANLMMLTIIDVCFPVNMPIWGLHGFLVGNWADGLCVGQFTGAQVGLAWA